jgi:hypothetical protein
MRLGEGVGCAGTLILSLAVLMGMGPQEPPRQRPIVEQAFPPASLKDASFSARNGTFYFERVREGNDWRLTYRFLGLARMHEVTCKVNIKDSQTLIDHFSYSDTEREEIVAKELERRVKAEAVSLGLLSFRELTFKGLVDDKGRFVYYPVWSWKAEASSFPDAAREEKERFDKWYDDNRQKLVLAAERTFLPTRGFIYDDKDDKQGIWMIDYSRLVAEAAPVLERCSEEFAREIGDHPEILMRFFQGLSYKYIEDKNTGWETGGVRVPSSVLLQSEGDCDSNAVTFCVLERRNPRQLLLFRSLRRSGDRTPGHALLGIETISRTGRQKWDGRWQRTTLDAKLYRDHLRIGKSEIDYDPCEVVSNPKFRPLEYGEVGIRHEKGHDVVRDDYRVIPIAPLKEYIASEEPSRGPKTNHQ